MNNYPQGATGEQLCHMAEDYEDRAAEYEIKISDAEREVMSDLKSISEAFDMQESGDDVEAVYLALAKMFQEYKSTARSYDDRVKGIFDIFCHEIAPVYERCVNKEAKYRAENPEHEQ